MPKYGKTHSNAIPQYFCFSSSTVLQGLASMHQLPHSQSTAVTGLTGKAALTEMLCFFVDRWQKPEEPVSPTGGSVCSFVPFIASVPQRAIPIIPVGMAQLSGRGPLGTGRRFREQYSPDDCAHSGMLSSRVDRARSAPTQPVQSRELLHHPRSSICRTIGSGWVRTSC